MVMLRVILWKVLQEIADDDHVEVDAPIDADLRQRLQICMQTQVCTKAGFQNQTCCRQICNPQRLSIEVVLIVRSTCAAACSATLSADSHLTGAKAHECFYACPS